MFIGTVKRSRRDEQPDDHEQQQPGPRFAAWAEIAECDESHFPDDASFALAPSWQCHILPGEYSPTQHSVCAYGLSLARGVLQAHTVYSVHAAYMQNVRVLFLPADRKAPRFVAQLGRLMVRNLVEVTRGRTRRFDCCGGMLRFQDMVSMPCETRPRFSAPWTSTLHSVDSGLQQTSRAILELSFTVHTLCCRPCASLDSRHLCRNPHALVLSRQCGCALVRLMQPFTACSLARRRCEEEEKKRGMQ